MHLIGSLGDRAQVMCCACQLVGVYEPGMFWRCERCGGQLFWRADRSASYDRIRDRAGGDDKLRRATREAIRKIPKRRISVRWDSGGQMIVTEKPELLGVR